MRNVIDDRLSTCIIYNDICKILDSALFPCCTIKGKALSLQAYNDYSVRKSGDVDLLISRNNVKLLENILLNYGYHFTNKNRSDRILCLNLSHQMPPYLSYTNFDGHSLVIV
jgi:hypothetical protein